MLCRIFFSSMTLCNIQRSECGGTWWRTGGEVKGKLANGVGSQYSYTASGHSVSSITTADAHTSAASSRLNWLLRRFKWTRPFRRKKKSGFCACAIRFRTSSTYSLNTRSVQLIFSILFHPSPAPHFRVILIYLIKWPSFSTIQRHTPKHFLLFQLMHTIIKS